jgi:hypothetical protein
VLTSDHFHIACEASGILNLFQQPILYSSVMGFVLSAGTMLKVIVQEKEIAMYVE